MFIIIFKFPADTEPLYFDTWADAPRDRTPPHPGSREGWGGGEGGKYVTGSVAIRVDGFIVVSTDSREEKTESPIADEPRM